MHLGDAAVLPQPGIRLVVGLGRALAEDLELAEQAGIAPVKTLVQITASLNSTL